MEGVVLVGSGSKSYAIIIKGLRDFQITLEEDERIHNELFQNFEGLTDNKVWFEGLTPDLCIIDDLRQDRKFSGKFKQNNDWRKGRKFNGYHREF